MSISLRSFVLSLIPSHYRPFAKRLYLRFFKNNYTGLRGLDKKLISKISPNKHGYYVELGANDGITQSNTFKLQADYAWRGLLIEPSPSKSSECFANRKFNNAPIIECCCCVDFSFPNDHIEIQDLNLMSVAQGLNLSSSDIAQQVKLAQPHLPVDDGLSLYKAKATTLQSLFDKHHVPFNFDLLSLDVEGNELSVLQGIDLNIYMP